MILDAGGLAAPDEGRVEMAKLTANGTHPMARYRRPNSEVAYTLRSDGAILARYLKGDAWTISARIRNNRLSETEMLELFSKYCFLRGATDRVNL